jgi:hypothetical protein
MKTINKNEKSQNSLRDTNMKQHKINAPKSGLRNEKSGEQGKTPWKHPDPSVPEKISKPYADDKKAELGASVKNEKRGLHADMSADRKLNTAEVKGKSDKASTFSGERKDEARKEKKESIVNRDVSSGLEKKAGKTGRDQNRR